MRSEPRLRGVWRILCGLTLVIAGCSDPLAPTANELQVNLMKWRSLGIGAYRYEYRLNCFCGGPGVEPVGIVVQDDSVVTATILETQEAVDTSALAGYPTIDDLFDVIAAAIEGKAHSIRAEYDTHYGYPTDVFIDYEKNAIDEEHGFFASQLQVIR